MTSPGAKKLLNSKWTKVKPERKERHFMVTEVEYDERGVVTGCLIEAVLTNRTYSIDWRGLRDREQWIAGWQ